RALAVIAGATGLNIVRAAGYYVAASHPADMDRRSVDDLAREIVADVTTGVGDTGVRSGLIGEIGCTWPWTDNEKKVVRAAVIAQRETGAPLMIHPGRHPHAPMEIAEYIRKEGGDLRPTIMCHICRTIADVKAVIDLARTGIWLEYDLFGLETSYYPYNPSFDLPNDGGRMAHVLALIEAGHHDQILMSHDIAYKTALVKYGGYGYHHLLGDVVPRLRAKGPHGPRLPRLPCRTPPRALAFARPPHPRPEPAEATMASNVVRVGDVEILALSDGALEFDLCNFFPTIPEGEWGPYESHLTGEHKIRFNLGSYLIRADGRTVLVDTGLGPRPADTPDVPWGRLLADFEANRVRLDQVDMVVMTHLHRDHVGWNLTPQGGKLVPTFPKARYWMSAKDLAACHQPDLQPQRFVNAPTCLGPPEAVGVVETRRGEHSLTKTLTAVPPPGHTPGHMSILVTSGGEKALVLGDAAHSPVQLHEPDWVSRADMDPELTRQTRRALLDPLGREQILGAAAPFQAPGIRPIGGLQGPRARPGPA